MNRPHLPPLYHSVPYIVTIKSHDPSTLSVEAYNPKNGQIFRAKMQKAVRACPQQPQYPRLPLTTVFSIPLFEWF